jgi:hypothetical protein
MIQIEIKPVPLNLVTTWNHYNLSLSPSVSVQPEGLDLPRELANAPIDDEPETPEEAVAVAEARANQQDLIDTGELRRRLGL